MGNVYHFEKMRRIVNQPPCNKINRSFRELSGGWLIRGPLLCPAISQLGWMQANLFYRISSKVVPTHSPLLGKYHCFICEYFAFLYGLSYNRREGGAANPLLEIYIIPN